jgi:hypothetical protein
MAWSLAAPAKRERALHCEMARTPDADQAGLRIEVDAVADTLRPGPRAAMRELALVTRAST